MEISSMPINDTVFLIIKGTEYHQIAIDSIVAVQVVGGKYLEITTTFNKHFILTPLKSISIYLSNFIKVNKGLMINRYYILKLTHQEKDKSKYNLVMKGPKDGFWTIEISDYIAKNILKQL